MPLPPRPFTSRQGPAKRVSRRLDTTQCTVILPWIMNRAIVMQRTAHQIFCQNCSPLRGICQYTEENAVRRKVWQDLDRKMVRGHSLDIASGAESNEGQPVWYEVLVCQLTIPAMHDLRRVPKPCSGFFLEYVKGCTKIGLAIRCSLVIQLLVQVIASCTFSISTHIGLWIVTEEWIQKGSIACKKFLVPIQCMLCRICRISHA